MENVKKIKLFLLPTALFLAVFFGMRAGQAQAAATLSISPYSGSYQVGQTFSIKISAASQDIMINAASGVISFPQDKLEITSLSKTGSIITLWAQDPNFSNITGTINFEGVVLNPGFQGNDGRILTVSFRVKAAGEASVAFASGSLLANDGLGTNIINGFVNANFGLKPKTQNQEAGESTTPSETSPLAPQISSLTHPNPNNWYNNNNPKFTWGIPAGITGVKILYDKYPQSVPSVVYAPAISEKSLQNIPDGTWYFHVQFKDANGWGSVSHFRFQIDTIPPLPMQIKFPHGQKTKDPRPVVIFNTIDTLSGINHYVAKIEQQETKSVSDKEATESNPYTLPIQLPGKHTLIVDAYDNAGNITTATGEFEIESLESPHITEYPSEIKSGDIIRIVGETYPEATVFIFLKNEKNEEEKQSVVSDTNGEFRTIWLKRLDAGAYRLSAEVVDRHGAQSARSEEVFITAEQSPLFAAGEIVLNYFAAILILLGCLGIIAFAIWYSWKKFMKVRMRLQRDIEGMGPGTHHAFDVLRESMQKHLKLLEHTRTKRELTPEEERILNQLRKDADHAEETIEKNIDGLKRDLK